MRAPLFLVVSLLALSVACGGGGKKATPTSPPSAALSTPVSTSPAQPTTTLVPPLVTTLNDIDFIDAQTGWAAGPNLIMRTTDGGQTWASQYSGGETITALDFADARHGWAVAAGALLATTDAGATWSPAGQPAVPLVEVDFVSATAGFGVATSESVPPYAQGILVATGDGGTTWTTVSTPSPVQSACAADANNVWAGTAMSVLHSTDGGTTWPVSFTLPAAAGPGDWSATVRCAGSAAWALFTDGAAVGHVAHVMYRTLDGATWDVMMAEAGTVANAIPATPSPGPYPGPFSIVDAQTVFVMGFCPPCGNATSNIRHTLDGGASWSADTPVGEGAQPRALAFVDAANGWALLAGTNSAQILATADAGQTWTKQYP